MATRLNVNCFKYLNIIKISTRHRSQRRNLGKPPGVARTLAQRLEELYYKDPSLHFKVNIGYALPKYNRRQATEEHVKILRKLKENPEFEMLARDNKLILNLDEVQEDWESSDGPVHKKSIADHYGVYQHLFGDAYFYPVINMKINYENNTTLAPVYRGNILKPNDTLKQPSVEFKSEPDDLWTLVMTTPDGHFNSENLEYVHWMITNIKGGDLSTGDVIFDYLQALPMKGLGYYRYIYILYKQEKKIDLKIGNKFNGVMEDRNFSTYNFYKEHQDIITPAGLSFFTTDWDESVREFHHKVLKIESTEFCYDFPEHYYKKQTWFPIREAFNLYLDRYRDEKEIAKEHLVKKLKNIDPFKEPQKKLKYPNAIPFKPGMPSWLKTEIRKERLNQARYKDYE